MNKDYILGLALLFSVFFFGLMLGIITSTEESTSPPEIRLYGPVFADYFYSKLPLGAEIHIRDCYYYLVSFEDMKKLLKWDKTDERKWVADEYDCDDFAFDLWRNISRHYHIALGVLGIQEPDGTLHMMNIFFAVDGNVYLIEPQTDEIFPISDFHGTILELEM